jgi:hypothetical protein
MRGYSYITNVSKVCRFFGEEYPPSQRDSGGKSSSSSSAMLYIPTYVCIDT